MERFNPDKLTVEFRDVTPTGPLSGRKYTQTHSDITADLFVTIGLHYALDKINPAKTKSWQNGGLMTIKRVISYGLMYT